MTEAHNVCPWWLGYLLASPIRRLFQNPDELLSPFVKPGMTVLEPGPGMGFFTLPLARMVGPTGRVHVRDIQQPMLNGLLRRARKAGLQDRIEARLVNADSLQVGELTGQVDVVCAFAMVHELPSQERFFAEVTPTLKQGGTLLLAEPAGHVSVEHFAGELGCAAEHGLRVVARPQVRRSQVAVLSRG